MSWATRLRRHTGGAICLKKRRQLAESWAQYCSAPSHSEGVVVPIRGADIMVEYKTVGTGITARDRVTISLDEFKSEKQLLEEMKTSSRWPPLNYRLKIIESVCGHVLRKAGLPDHAEGQTGRAAINGSLEDVANGLRRNDPDSDIAYCARLIVLIKDLRQSTDKVVGENCAFEIGRLWTEWQIKLKWEKPALRGRNQLDAAKHNFQESNEAKRAKAKAVWGAGDRSRRRDLGT